jgi:hypothetical protein
MLNANREELTKIHHDFGVNGTFSFLGIGVGFRGKLYRNDADRAQGIELTTRYALFCYLPIIPMASYRIHRVKRSPSRRRAIQLISKEPIVWKQAIPFCLGSILTIVIVLSLFKWLS